MKSKKIVSIFITIIIAITIIATMFLVRNSMAKDKIKSKVKLSEEEKSNLNYEQLIEDIEFLENGHGVKHAKKQERQSTGNKIEDIINAGNDYVSGKGDFYIGDGYTISYMIMPEMIEYDFYTNDKKLIYSIHNGVPLETVQEHNERMFKENKSDVIFYGAIVVIVVIATTICIVTCRKNGRTE